jgi:uncharacterized protein
VPRLRGLPLFFTVTFGYTWTVVGLMLLTGARIEWTMAAAFGPMLGAMAAQGGWRAFRLTDTPARTAGACLLGIALVVVTYVVLPALLVADARQLRWTALLSPAFYNASTLLGGPLGEEPGWRGYALPRLQQRWGPWRAALGLGVIWTCWHLPMFFNPQWPHPPFGIYLGLMVSLSVLLTYATNMARWAVLPAILMHAAFNTVSLYIPAFLEGVETSADRGVWQLVAAAGKALGMKPFGLDYGSLLTAVAVGVALLFLVVTRGRLGASRTR